MMSGSGASAQMNGFFTLILVDAVTSGKASGVVVCATAMVAISKQTADSNFLIC